MVACHWSKRSPRYCVALLFLICIAAGCGEGRKAEPASGGAVPPAADPDSPPPPPAYEANSSPGAQASLASRFTGDLAEMVARQMVRIGAPYSRTFYYIDKGVQRGLAYELIKTFEEELNRSRKSGNTRIHVVLVPIPRDQLATALTEGKIDVVAAQVTIRPELQALVDFTNPTRTNIREVVVTAPGAPPIASVDDLAGKRRLHPQGQQVLPEPGRAE
jgi:membrane-bound lytic murein transglycosylase MltF